MESMKYSDTAFAVSLDPRQVVTEVHANTVDLPKRTVREHIEYLDVFLQALALQFQDEFSIIQAQRLLAKCKTALGYT